jgi:hypothetical protein
MYRLMHDWWLSNWNPVDAAYYSVTAAKAKARFFKRFFAWDTREGAEAFVAWGYNNGGGNLPKGLPTFPSGEVVEGDKFDFRWQPYRP